MYILIKPINFTGLLLVCCWIVALKKAAFFLWKLNSRSFKVSFYTSQHWNQHWETPNISCCTESLVWFSCLYNTMKKFFILLWVHWENPHASSGPVSFQRILIRYLLSKITGGISICQCGFQAKFPKFLIIPWPALTFICSSSSTSDIRFYLNLYQHSKTQSQLKKPQEKRVCSLTNIPWNCSGLGLKA